ncbi:fatty acid synthase-like protein [Leptotrombidium deliense]|uniref:Fatty acid synthase-like protein n=1 Tax=Leptotrombidium deliense TaxID=299467 RepID=A0A443SIN2_9ACAR|nr:fatty acid synthase-like protein [Leptotrombidium deliense]
MSKKGFMSLPRRTGKIKNVDKFDSEFFKISNSEANYMDPQMRLLHETSYEAIWDAVAFELPFKHDKLLRVSLESKIIFGYNNYTIISIIDEYNCLSIQKWVSMQIN